MSAADFLDLLAHFAMISTVFPDFQFFMMRNNLDKQGINEKRFRRFRYF